MLLADIKVLFIFLPLFLLIIAFVPQKWKPAMLALCGIGYCISTGWKALVFTLFSAIFGWFSVRCCPRTMTGTKAAKAMAWVVIDIIGQLILLYFSSNVSCFITLIPAIQSIAAIFERINGNFRVPSLPNYLAYCLSLPRILGGIPLDFSERNEIIRTRKFSIERTADGIQHIVIGIFKINVLSLPIGRFYTMICSPQTGQYLTFLDAWMFAFAIFFMILFRLQGIQEIGQGILLTLGYNIPDVFDSTVFSTSLRDFCKRIWTPMYRMGTKIFGLTDENINDMSIFSYGLRIAGIIILPVCILRRDSLHTSICFCVFTLILAITERVLKQKRLLDIIPHKIRIIVTNLCIIILCYTLFCDTPSGKISGIFSLIGKNGFLLSSYAKYAFSWYWSNFLLCVLCTFPIRKTITTLCDKYEKLEKASIIVIPIVELGLLTLSIMQILSSNVGL